MAFDRNDDADKLALQTEEATDPLNMGYAAAGGSTNKTLALFNDGDKNVGGEMTSTELTVGVLLDVMVPSDFDAQQVSDGERRFIESFLSREFFVVIEQWRAKIRDAFKSNSNTVQALDSLTRLLSRGEVLFGEDTLISRDDWIAARDYVPPA